MVDCPAPFALDAGEGERLVFGDLTILVRAAAAATAGAFSLFEEVPPLLDTPLHVHEREDELFYALEGEHVIQVGATSSASVLEASSSRRAPFHMHNGESCKERVGCSC